MLKKIFGQKGQAPLVYLISVTLAIIFGLLVYNVVSLATLQAASDMLTNSGYIVLSPGASSSEYELLADKVDEVLARIGIPHSTIFSDLAVIDSTSSMASYNASSAAGKSDTAAAQATMAASKADAAQVAAFNAYSKADIAASKAELAATNAASADARIILFNSPDTLIYPDSTSSTVTLVAGITNNFSSWTEISTSLGVTLSSKFVSKSGYISEIYFYDYASPNKEYIIQLSYGASKVPLGSIMAHSSVLGAAQFHSKLVPAGQTVYYRMMSSGANSTTVKVGIRYFYE